MSADVFLHALTSYFVIIDPIGAALIFHGLTQGNTADFARRMAIRSVLISCAIVLVFGFWGEGLLGRLGISIEALRVSGGLLLFFTAFNMITQGQEDKPLGVGGEVDISVFPMSIPLIAGPGCLTLTILLFSQTESLVGIVSLVLAVLCINLLTLLALVFSRKIQRVIGRTGDDILRRLLGVILAALSIQFIVDGVRQLARG